MQTKMTLGPSGRARRLAKLHLALLIMAAAPFNVASARDLSAHASLSGLDSQHNKATEDVWIDAFDMSVCGRAELRPWQEEQSAFGCAGKPGASERGNVAPRIVGNDFAQEGEFPSFVHINKTIGGFHCGATLIHKNLAVTAAHCVHDEENRTLIFGSNLLNGTGGVTRQPDRWCFLTKFVGVEKGHDLAIIRFKDDIKYSSRISPACLNLDYRPSDETICAFAGLGCTIFHANTSVSPQLKTLRVKRSCLAPTVDQSCYERFGIGLQVTQKGDSGSPVICYDRYGSKLDERARAFAVGANSWGDDEEPRDIRNFVADFHQLKPDFLELLRAIRGKGAGTRGGVKCVVPSRRGLDAATQESD